MVDVYCVVDVADSKLSNATAAPFTGLGRSIHILAAILKTLDAGNKHIALAKVVKVNDPQCILNG